MRGRKVNRLTPTLHLVGVFFVFFFTWYIGTEERLTGLFWALPGVFVGTFAMLWNAISKLERRLARLERREPDP